MIVVEEKHHQEAKGYGYEDPFDIQIPKVNDPVSILSGLESADSWYAVLLGPAQTPRKVREADPEQSWKYKGVISDDAADPRLPNCAGTDLLEVVYRAEEQHRYYDRQIAAFET